ncbi:MAG: chorismate-binding protein, partial [Gammaproteobacteria bacterium]
QALREQQKVEYAALFLFDESPIISLSPECFFKKEETKITVKPMKGTAPRGRTPHEDAEQKNFLKNDEKNRAENIIIVDLLRNDLSRIAEPHSVQTTRLFDIETYETLLQMTSTITANIRKELPIATILKHLFPCGSITGAPKIRTMEILRELEKTPREIYTGTIGFITPDNDMHFNVAIRTLLLNQDNTGELGIGGGIIYESDSEKEYEEILLKAKFLTNLNFQLIECFLFDKNYRYLDDHLTRLKSSANTFCFSFDEKMIRKKLDQLKSFLDPKQQYKIKLSLNKKGEAQLTTDKISLEPRNKKIALANITMNSKDAILQHKTTAAHIRGIYDKALDQTSHYDVIFTNEKNEITEGARHNIFIEKDGSLYTPPITSGCLPGIMREKILTDSHYRCEEKVLTPEDLKTADKIYLTNSVRGMLEVDLA